MRNLILNAFSLNMVSPEIMFKLRIQPITKAEIHASFHGGQAINSFVDHETTAALLEKDLNSEKLASFIPIAFNRGNVILTENDTAFVGQYIGERLPEGATELPKGAEIKWFKVFFPKPKNRIITSEVSDLNFEKAYKEACDKMYEGETLVSTHFTDRGAVGLGEILICTLVVSN